MAATAAISSPEELLALDRQYLWHPYAAINSAMPVFPVASAAGVRLQLHDGRQLIDGMASWWSVIHGYNHPRLNAAASSQLERMAHVMFGGLTHAPAVELARLLVEITPVGLDKVFFCDSGSVAVEVAMKMAVQYQFARRQPNRNRFLTIRGGYHGDTFHAMAVCDPLTGMHQLYTGILPKYYFAERPACRFHEKWCPEDCFSLALLAKEHHEQLCAVILEPVVQGAGGMHFYHPEYLRQVKNICQRYDLLLIADEIATGFGRTGALFACDHAGISPDILCLGKALTGGYLTLAATVCSDAVAAVISRGAPGVFMHGPTFMANPLACAVALASVQLLLESDWRATVTRIERGLRLGLENCARLPGVRDVRVLGAIGVVEMQDTVDMLVMPQLFVEQGVWVRPFGRLVYVMPPYCISDADLQQVTSAIYTVLASLEVSS